MEAPPSGCSEIQKRRLAHYDLLFHSVATKTVGAGREELFSCNPEATAAKVLQLASPKIQKS